MQNLLYRPVVLSYFSQRGDKEKDHLSSLEKEYKSIAKAWEQSEIHSDSNQYFNVFFPARGSAVGDDVAEDIRHFKKRIVLFHFSGHAGSQQLFFRDKDANAAGLAGLLGEAPNLKLVVLNGCATHDQVKLLFENKVKIVIATQGKINDSIAGGFAVTFFAALSSTDYTIRGAFAHALNKLKQDHSQLNTQSAEPIIWRGLDTGSDDDCNRWELYIRDEECEKDLDDPNWWKIEEVPTLYSKPAPAKLLSTKGVNDPNVFIGRKEELETIFERLNKVGQLLLINAEGGIGKTTLAARYWNESLYEYKHNAWLFCENGIVNALKELAPNLNLDLRGLDEAQQLVALRHALSKVHDDFLLVLDNANDADDIRIFRQEFEGFHWHVLITSRCQGVLEKEQELPITHLPPPQAKELFERYYREDSPDFDTLLDRLLEAIRYHTLLVELFAKNLKEASELGMTLVGFLQKLETEGLYLGEDSFEIQTRYTDYVRKTAATTDEILDILYDFSTLSEAQRYLLVNLALLPAEGYKLQFLIDLMAPEDQRVFRDTVKSLYRRGWLGGLEQMYRLSPVVQGLVLKKNQVTLWEDTKKLIIQFSKFMEFEPELDNAYIKFRWLLLSQSIMNYLIDCKDPEFYNFKNRRGLLLLSLGAKDNLIEAEQLLRSVLNYHISYYGEQSEIVAISQSNLASVLTKLNGIGNLLESEKLLRNAIVICSGQPNSTYFGHKANLAIVLQSLSRNIKAIERESRLKEAESLLREVLRFGIAYYGEKHFRVAEAQSNLAMLLHNLALTFGKDSKIDKLNEALLLMKQALSIDIAQFGLDTPMISLRKNNLALILREIGGIDNLREAKILLLETINRYIHFYGETSPKLIEPVWNLFLVHYDLKDTAACIKWIKFIYPISEKHLADSHDLKRNIQKYYQPIAKYGL